MRIDLAGLEEGRGKFVHDYAPDELVIPDNRVALVVPPTVSGQIRSEGRRVHVRGRVTARVQMECDRCLKPVELPIDSSFKLEYVTPEDYQAQQAIELTQADLDLSIFDGGVLDIDELVAEEILLAVPDHVLCIENCKGICERCGADKNTTDCNCEAQQVDPRWAGLEKLVNGKS
jgi:uncharacterized protein